VKLVENGSIGHKESFGSVGGIQTDPFVVSEISSL
jgi:hypothetical protein